MSELTTVDSVVHQEHLKIGFIFDKKLLESIGEDMFMLFLGSVADGDQRFVALELSSDSVVDTSGSSPTGRKFMSVVLRLESCESLGSFLDLVDFDEWLDGHL